MKLLMENWRKYIKESGFGEGTPPKGELYKKQVKYLEEEVQGNPKVIFMAGAPGSGKSSVIEALGLEGVEIVNPDIFYEPALEKAGLGLNLEKIKNDYLDARDELKELLKTILGLEEPEKTWPHDEMMGMYQNAVEQAQVVNDPVLNDDVKEAKEKYDYHRERVVTNGKLFAQTQKDAKGYQATLTEEGRSFIIDGTGGVFGRIRNQKKQLESLGYETAMIFVDTPLQIAIDRQDKRGAENGRSLGSKSVEKSWNAVNKNKIPYESLFNNFFLVKGTEEEMPESVASARPALSQFLSGQQLNEADWQKWVRANYNKQVGAYTRGGNNKTRPSGWKDAPISYRGAPPGATGG
jgi:hypothetical protein